MNIKTYTPALCIKAACKAYRIEEADITRKTRALDVVDPRDLAILLIKKRFPATTNREISELVGLTTSAVTYSLKRSREKLGGKCNHSRRFTSKYEKSLTL